MPQESKICTRCKLPKPLDDFGLYTASPDGRNPTCLACRSDIEQRSRRNRAAIYRERQRNRFEEARALLMELKSQPCTDCGQSFPWFCMDYDHRNPAEKVRSVSQWLGTGNIKAMLDEIERCDLVCAVCHRIRTHIQYEDGLIQIGRPRIYA